MTESAPPRRVHALEEAVQRHVRQRCHDQVRQLAVRVSAGCVIVRGSTSSYYVKQLALEGTRTALKNSDYELQIEVDVS